MFCNFCRRGFGKREEFTDTLRPVSLLMGTHEGRIWDQHESCEYRNRPRIVTACVKREDVERERSSSKRDKLSGNYRGVSAGEAPIAES